MQVVFLRVVEVVPGNEDDGVLVKQELICRAPQTCRCARFAIIHDRLIQVVNARGSIDADCLNDLFARMGSPRDTDLEVIATAGRIRKLRITGKWDPRDQAAFERKFALRVCEKG